MLMNGDAPSTRGFSILAAGGIVRGVGKNAGKIAVVRRKRYPGEVALPKGKLVKDEHAIDAALREVQEETGCKIKKYEYAGSTHYLVGTIPKAVFYFLMDEESDDECKPKDTREIESVVWSKPEDAINELTHREDRQLISAVFGLARSRKR
jgi:8-oxo-dGTP diphosphatase